MGKKAKKALGRGLDSLIGTQDTEVEVEDTEADAGGAKVDVDVTPTVVADAPVEDREGVVMLKLAEILQNPWQPRQVFDEVKLQELSESIKVHGVVQPVIVTKAPEGYRLIVGERRCRASRLAGLDTIPAIVRDCADQQMLEVALIENLHRQDLNPVEEAQAFQYLLREHNLTHEQLAERVGCSRPAVTNSLRLLVLPDEIRQDLIDGVIKPGHARAILSLEDEKMRYKAWQRIKDGNLSVRQAEQLVAGMAQVVLKAAPTKAPKVELSPDWQEVVEQLRNRFNAEVRITPKSKGKGRLEFYYNSQSELESLVTLMFYHSRR